MDSLLSRRRCHLFFFEFHFSTTRFTTTTVHSFTSGSPGSVNFWTNKFHSLLLGAWIKQLPRWIRSGHFQEISTCNAGATCYEKELVDVSLTTQRSPAEFNIQKLHLTLGFFPDTPFCMSYTRKIGSCTIFYHKLHSNWRDNKNTWFVLFLEWNMPVRFTFNINMTFYGVQNGSGKTIFSEYCRQTSGNL